MPECSCKDTPVTLMTNSVKIKQGSKFKMNNKGDKEDLGDRVQNKGRDKGDKRDLW